MFWNQTLSSNKDRNGQSYRASFESRFNKGYTKNVHCAVLTGNGRLKKAIVKTFRHEPGTQQLCDEEIRKVEKAREIVNAFNKTSCGQVNCKMEMTEVLKAAMDTMALTSYLPFNGRRLHKDEWVLIEDKHKKFIYFLDQYGKSHPEVKRVNSLQTLLHFSYHHTSGDMVLTDLKGSKTTNGFKFSIPTIHSTGKLFGEKDEAVKGIAKCFESHVCNEACAAMLKPDSQTDIKSRPRAPSAPYDPEIVHGLPIETRVLQEPPPAYTPSPDSGISGFFPMNPITAQNYCSPEFCQNCSKHFRNRSFRNGSDNGEIFLE